MDGKRKVFHDFGRLWREKEKVAFLPGIKTSPILSSPFPFPSLCIFVRPPHPNLESEDLHAIFFQVPGLNCDNKGEIINTLGGKRPSKIDIPFVVSIGKSPSYSVSFCKPGNSGRERIKRDGGEGTSFPFLPLIRFPPSKLDAAQAGISIRTA